MLALVAGAVGRFLLASYLLAATVFVLVLVGYLAPRLSARFSLFLGLGAVLPIKWVASWQTFSWEVRMEMMEVMDLLPASLLLVALLLAAWHVIRSGRQPRVWRVPRVLTVASITLAVTALPAWALSAFLGGEDLLGLHPLVFYPAGLTAWVLAASGLLHAGARLHALSLRPPGKLLLATGFATALIVPVWGLFGEWIEESEPDPDQAPYDLVQQVLGDLNNYYPHWDTAPVTLEVLWDSHGYKLMAQAAACESDGAGSGEPCIGLLRVLRDMLAELRNGHTGLRVDSDVGHPGVRIRSVVDGVVIDWVVDDSDAERLGLRAGMEIVAVDVFTRL